MTEAVKNALKSSPNDWDEYGLTERVLNRQDDLGARSDSPHSAVVVLLEEARQALNQLAETVFAEQAVTPVSLETMRMVAQKLQDSICLAALCPTEPSDGVVTVLPDGTRRWEPR